MGLGMPSAPVTGAPENAEVTTPSSNGGVPKTEGAKIQTTTAAASGITMKTRYSITESLTNNIENGKVPENTTNKFDSGIGTESTANKFKSTTASASGVVMNARYSINLQKIYNLMHIKRRVGPNKHIKPGV